jgi:phosphoglucomutase
MGEETDRLSWPRSPSQAIDRATVARVADTFKIVYTPFHGCGYKLVPEALKGAGHQAPALRAGADGHRRQLPHGGPQPGESRGLLSGGGSGQEKRRDFIIGTDPDSDRVGVMVRDHSGDFRPVTGNQTGVLLLDYLIGAMRRAGRLPAKPVALKSIVTTEMARKVAEENGVHLLRHLHRLQIHGGEEKRAGDRRRGQGHLLL